MNKNDWDRDWLRDHGADPAILVIPNMGGYSSDLIVATTLAQAVVEVTAFKKLYTYRAIDMRDPNGDVNGDRQAHFLEMRK